MSAQRKLKYYERDGLLLLVRDTEKESYWFLNSAGKWQDGAGHFEKYFLNGEIGMEEISTDEARKMASKFGSNLVDFQNV